jgi:hypothetical protein
VKPINPLTKKILLNVRLTPEDKKRIEALAEKYARGNLTAWVVFAALNFRPKAK